MKTCQIIAAALMMGVLVFAGVAYTMNPISNPEVEQHGEQAEQPDMDEISFGLLVVSVMGLGVLTARRFVMFTQNRALNQMYAESESVDTETLMGLFQTRLIVSMAMLEGIAFFALVMFIVEGDVRLFGIATLMLVWMGANFPTNHKLQMWVTENSGKNPFGGKD